MLPGLAEHGGEQLRGRIKEHRLLGIVAHGVGKALEHDYLAYVVQIARSRLERAQKLGGHIAHVRLGLLCGIILAHFAAGYASVRLVRDEAGGENELARLPESGYVAADVLRLAQLNAKAGGYLFSFHMVPRSVCSFAYLSSAAPAQIMCTFTLCAREASFPASIVVLGQ